MDKLDKICIHWSVTGYKATADCLEHYHFVIEGDGAIKICNRPPESNLASSVKAGTYQAHCGGGNTDCIGVSMASMVGYEGKNHVGPAPITEVQFEACCKFVAQLCHKYSIPVNVDSIFTHRVFGLNHPLTSSAGKIDIEFLPTHPDLAPDQIDDFIRSKVQWYLDQIK